MGVQQPHGKGTCGGCSADVTYLRTSALPLPPWVLTGDAACYNTIQYNTKFVKRHVAVASEALANSCPVTLDICCYYVRTVVILLRKRCRETLHSRKCIAGDQYNRLDRLISRQISNTTMNDCSQPPNWTGLFISVQCEHGLKLGRLIANCSMPVERQQEMIQHMLITVRFVGGSRFRPFATCLPRKSQQKHIFRVTAHQSAATSFLSLTLAALCQNYIR